MTFTYITFAFEIIWLHTFSEFLSFVYMTSKAKYFIQLYWASQKTSVVLHVTLFYDSKIFIP